MDEIPRSDRLAGHRMRELILRPIRICLAAEPAIGKRRDA
jgi:hypothetical protein